MADQGVFSCQKAHELNAAAAAFFLFKIRVMIAWLV